MRYRAFVSDHALSAAELLEDLSEITNGLLYPSESDFPFRVFRWTAPTDVSPSAETVLLALGRSPQTPVSHVALSDVFAGLTSAEPAASERDVEVASRFRALQLLLESHLSDIRVFRVGATDVDVFILGRHASGHWVGLCTKTVET